MCYYNYIICETCNAEQKLPPVFCEKLSSGIICTKFDSMDTVHDNISRTLAMVVCQQSFDVTTAEVRLFDILRVETTWIDWTLCVCGLSYADICTIPSSDYDISYDCEVNYGNDTDYSEIDFDELLSEICPDIDHSFEDTQL